VRDARIPILHSSTPRADYAANCLRQFKHHVTGQNSANHHLLANKMSIIRDKTGPASKGPIVKARSLLAHKPRISIHLPHPPLLFFLHIFFEFIFTYIFVLRREVCRGTGEREIDLIESAHNLSLSQHATRKQTRGDDVKQHVCFAHTHSREAAQQARTLNSHPAHAYYREKGRRGY
jgi:hypothetical protein